MFNYWSEQNKLRQYIAGFSASLGALSLGATIGWSSPAMQHTLYDDLYNTKGDMDVHGWICASVMLGSVFSIIPVGLLLDKMGRKTIMLLVAPPFIAAWALIIFARNIYVLMLARFLQGLTAGSYIITVPVYCIEVAQWEARQIVSTFFRIFYVFGIFYAYVAGAFRHFMALNISCALLPIAFLISFIWMPETPMYYLIHNEHAKAVKSLQWLRGQIYDMELIRLQLEAKKITHVPFWISVLERYNLRAILVSTGIMFFLNFSGSVVVIFYGSYLITEFETESGFNSDISMVIVGLVFFVFCLISVLCLRFVKHRRLLLLTSFLMALSNAFMAMFFLLKQRRMSFLSDLNWLPMCNLCIFMAIYGLGMGTIPYVTIQHIFTDNFRITGNCIVYGFSNFFGFMVVKIFPAHDLDTSFWILTGFTILGWIYIYFFVPETKDIAEEVTQKTLAVSLLVKHFRK